MARLKSGKFNFKSNAGDVLEFIVDYSVNKDGVFSASVPDELDDIIPGVVKNDKNVSYGSFRSGSRPRILADMLDHLREALNVAGKEWATCESTSERVIVYSVDSKVGYCKTQDGRFFPNGYTDTPGEEVAGLGSLHASSHSDSYRIGIAAAVMMKTTHVRGSSTKVEYEYAPDLGNNHCFSETYHDRLNDFCGLHLRPEYMKQMFYTEDAAKFFYDIMIGMCKMADRIESFMADDDAVLRAIKSQTGLIGFDG